MIIGVRKMFIDRHRSPADDVYGIRHGAELPAWGPTADLVERVINTEKQPIHAALKQLYAALPDPARAKVEVRVGGMMPVHPRRQRLGLLLNAIEFAFPWLKKAPGYGSTATAAKDNSLLIHVDVDDGGISPDDLERVCRVHGKVHVRLKHVCVTSAMKDHENEPLSPIHLRVNDVQKTVTYASLFEGDGHEAVT